MKRASQSDRDLVVDILTESFKDNISVNYVVKPGKGKLKRIQRLMEYAFDMCYVFGEILLSDDDYGCALILYPEKKGMDFKQLILNIKLVFLSTGFGNIRRILTRERIIRKYHPKDCLFVHGWFLAVAPRNRNKGTALIFIRELIRESEIINRPVYIETSETRNLLLYERLGFQIFCKVKSDHTLHFLKREPANWKNI